MSGIIHSLRTLFGSPSTANNNTRITRSRAREEGGSDDDVFSSFENNDGTPQQQQEEDDDEMEESNGNNANIHTQPPKDNNKNIETQQQSDDDSGLSLATQEEPAADTNSTANNSGKEQTNHEAEANHIEEGINNNLATTTNNNDEESALLSSTLTDFFSHKTTETTGNLPQNSSMIMTYKQYKKSRKLLLQQYLTARFIGTNAASDNDDEEDMSVGGEVQGINNNDDDDSFFSSLLNGQLVHEDYNNHTAEKFDRQQQEEGEETEEGEDDDSVMQLETQPQTMPLPSTSPGDDTCPQSKNNNEEDEATPPKTQEEELTPSRTSKLFSGIKRKLGFVANNTANSSSQEDVAVREESSEKKKRAKINNNNNNNNNKQSSKRGIMWNGSMKSVPHVEHTFPTNNSTTKLQELDLYNSIVNIDMCEILKVWDVRNTKRMDKLYREEEESGGEGVVGGEGSEEVESSTMLLPYHSYENDGPLNTIYKRVFSIEVCQIIANDNNNNDIEAITDPTITNMTNTAFSEGALQILHEKQRKSRHSVQRVRIYFYNKYADVISNAYYTLQKESSSTQKKKTVPILMSLLNIPPECIMPRIIAPSSNPHAQQYIQNPLGDVDYGTLSPYCMCIGDKSTIKFGETQKLYFDNDDVEIRMVEAPVNVPLSVFDNSNETDFILDDAVVTLHTIKYGGKGYCMGGEQSDLVKRFVELRKQKESKASVGDAIMFNLLDDEEDEEMPDAAAVAGATNNPGLAGLRGTTTTNSQQHRRTNSMPRAGESTSEGGGGSDAIIRPRSVVSLSNLHPLLLQNNMQKLKERINVYGIVLGFSPPSLTRSQEWMMAIVLIDETIPLSNQVQGEAATTVDGNSSNSKEMHVPSVTLMIFSKDKAKLPLVKSAGDVICCEKVILQAWNGDAQLCARTHQRSNIVVVSPKQPRCPGDNEIINSTSPTDWSVSSNSVRNNINSNDETSTAAQSNNTNNLPLVNNLYRWGQKRLSNHPTVSPNCYLSIAGIGGNSDNDNNNHQEVSTSGDMTAVVTSIIAMPEELRRRDTPRGYIRLWDGTGSSQSDPLPPIPGVSTQPSDPPEQVLVDIEKIIKVSFSGGDGESHQSIQAPITLSGRVINAIIWEENLWSLIQREDSSIRIGSFVRLRNINKANLPTLAATTCLSVHAKSSLTPLPFDAYEVKRVLAAHDAKIRGGSPSNPTSAILPTTRSHTRQATAAQEMRNNGFSMIEECLQKSPPASFTIQFEVCGIIPECNSVDSMKLLCKRKKNNRMSTFQFALHVKDASADMDVLCLGKVAEELLGVTSQEILGNDNDDDQLLSGRQEKCEQAMNTLKELRVPGSVCEGKLRSVVGKDGKLYFILNSLLCISSEDM